MQTQPVATDPPSLARYLARTLAVGAPDVAGSLAVFPVFAAEPRLRYRAFAQAAAQGASVKELQSGASVNDLLVLNPTDLPLLLYEGEHVAGAQQDRTLDTSVLVAAGAHLRVPVSCVEAGRWDGARHAEPLSAAEQAAYPELRRAKNEQARRRAAAGEQARADQGLVWNELAAKSARHGAASVSGAMQDVFSARRDSIESLLAGIPLHDGQAGALVAIGGRFLVLDWVSRPEVFAALYPALARGYALDALEAPSTPAPGRAAAEAFLAAALHAPASERDGIGMGWEVRFEGPAAAGAALVAGEELVQMTAFAPAQPRTRIRRASRRRV